MSPLSFLESLAVAALPRPIPGEYRPLAGYLESLGYEPGPIRCVVDWVRRHGTAEGCLWITRAHEAEVDALLPGDGECGCPECTDESAWRRGLHGGILMSLGERIRARRKELRWSLDELGRRATLSKSYLSELERNLRGVGAESLLSLSTVLGIPMDQLVKGSNGQAVESGLVQFPARLQQWAFDSNVPYRHASCLYWCARTIIDHQPNHKRARIEDWDWARFHEALKPWLD
jgi:transcriptional regulator with XRE-family HTH domain